MAKFFGVVVVVTNPQSCWGETSRVRRFSADRGTFDPTHGVARFRFADLPPAGEPSTQPTVWRGSDLPTCQQGMNVLGTPLGHPDFVKGVFGIQMPPEVFGQNPSAAGCSSVMVVVGPLCSSTGHGTWGNTRILHEE